MSAIEKIKVAGNTILGLAIYFTLLALPLV